MASVDRERDEDGPLDLKRFNSIIEEYSSSFRNPPKNAHQVAQFCKERRYSLKYGQIAPFFNVWSKEQEAKSKSTTLSSTSTTKGVADRDSDSEEDDEEEEEEEEIDWDAFWDEYKEKYQYVPKKAVHLWNFAKEDKKMTSVKYKEARTAFDRIVAERVEVCSPKPIEGRTRSNTDLGLKSVVSSMSTLCGIEEDNKVELKLKIGRYSSDEEIESIKSSFLECLELFRASIKHDPANPLQLFNFINEDTSYKARYGDVKSCLNYATKHKWFKPMKRMKKVYKGKKDEGVSPVNEPVVASELNDDVSDGEGVEFVLEVDHAKIEEEKRKLAEKEKEVVVIEVMTDDEFDAVLVQYNTKYENPPRNASQIMNFAKEELGQIYKYKACRIAFNRWKNCRGSVMPSKETKKQNESEPEQPGQEEEEEENDDPDEEEEDEEEEEESD